MHTVKLAEGVTRTEAPNGLVVLTEEMPALRSAAAGIWVRTASAHEAPEKMGVSHLLEHMVFKGTERRSAHDIALALESRGGALDAYTGRDHTTYQARILDADIPLAVDVLTDLVRRPQLRDEDVTKERQVVIEEIAMVEDNPDDLVFDLHAGALWRRHSYAYRIVGTRDTVGALGSTDLKALHRGTYHPRHMVVAAAGSVKHDRLLALLTEQGWFDLEPGPERQLIGAPGGGTVGERKITRDSNQVHIVLGSETFPYRDARRQALSLLTTIFGGGMSSRLFQKIREDLGLAYTVYAYNSFHQVTGMSGVYVGTSGATAQQALDAIREEYRRLSESSLTQAELESAKQQVKGQMVLALEGPVSRMYRIAGLELFGEPYTTIDEAIRRVDAVTAEQVAGVAREFFDPAKQTIVWLGPN